MYYKNRYYDNWIISSCTSLFFSFENLVCLSYIDYSMNICRTMIYSHRYIICSVFIFNFLIDISAYNQQNYVISACYICGLWTSEMRKIWRSCDINTVVMLDPDKLLSCRRRVPTIAPGELHIREFTESRCRSPRLQCPATVETFCSDIATCICKSRLFRQIWSAKPAIDNL